MGVLHNFRSLRTFALIVVYVLLAAFVVFLVCVGEGFTLPLAGIGAGVPYRGR